MGDGFDDVPLFDMEEPAKRKPPPEPKGAWWQMLKHTRFNCELCASLFSVNGGGPIRPANFIRKDSTGSSAYCSIHAEDKKLEDQKAGLWNAR